MKFTKVDYDYIREDGKVRITQGMRLAKTSSVGFSTLETYKKAPCWNVTGITDNNGNKITYVFTTLKEAKDFASGNK